LIKVNDWKKYNQYRVFARLDPELYQRLGLYMKTNNYRVSQALTEILNQNLPQLPND